MVFMEMTTACVDFDLYMFHEDIWNMKLHFYVTLTSLIDVNSFHSLSGALNCGHCRLHRLFHSYHEKRTEKSEGSAIHQCIAPNQNEEVDH